MKRLIRSSVSIFGIAESKRDIQSELRNHSGELFRHLLKLYCYPDHQSAEHWKDEIYSFLNDVALFKHNKKLPSSKFILQNTYDIWEDSTDIAVKKIMRDYGSFPWSRVRSKDFHRMAYDYFSKLADVLSKEGSVTRQEVHEMLEESGF